MKSGRLTGARISKSLQYIGSSLGSIFISSDYKRSAYMYTPLSYQEELKRDEMTLMSDWKEVGNILGTYIGK